MARMSEVIRDKPVRSASTLVYRRLKSATAVKGSPPGLEARAVPSIRRDSLSMRGTDASYGLNTTRLQRPARSAPPTT
jgi:hypothetical protein